MAERSPGEVDPREWGIYSSESNTATIAARVPQRVKDQWSTDVAEVAAAASCSKGEAAAVGVQMLNALKQQWIASASRIEGRAAVASERTPDIAALEG